MFYTLFKKELKHYFNSPIAYVILIAFLLLSGWFFVSPLFVINQASVQTFFQYLPLLFIFFAPAVSMRLIAEEKRQGTIEGLETLPVSDTIIVLAKFTSAVTFMMVGFAVTLVFPLAVQILGALDWGVILSGYLGAILLVGAMISYGMYISSLTKNQIVAFIIATVISLFFILASSFTTFLPDNMSALFEYIDFQNHYQAFTRGTLDLRDIVFFLSIIVFMGLLTGESLDQRNI